MRIEDKKFQGMLSSSTSRFQLWQKLLKEADLKSVLEIGVWKGDFAAQTLKECEHIEQYYMIDPWANLPDWNKPYNVDTEMFDDIYAEAMDKTAFASEKVIVLRGRTKEVIDQIPDNSLDFAYIDGDHTLRGITIDLIMLLPKMKEGGFIGCDDFINTPWQHGVQSEPTLVCPFGIYFAEAMDLPIVALPFTQCIIQKRSDAAFSFIDVTGNYSDISLNKLPSRFSLGRFKSLIKRVLMSMGLIK